MKSQCLKLLVQNICNGSYCQSQLVEFINLTQKISLGYLKYQEIIGKRISGERVDTDVELQDLAVDCIAELFSGDGLGNFPQLQKYYLPKFEEDPNISDAEVLVFTRRLVVRKTKQELSRIFRERDPEGAKIVRNIKVAIRTSDQLQMFADLGKEYVFYKSDLEISDEAPIDIEEIADYLRRKEPPIPEDVLHSRFIDIYNPSDSVSSSIRKLLKNVYQIDGYQNYLPVDTIVKLIRQVKFDAFKENMAADDNVPTPLDVLETKEIEGYIDVVMERVNEKIEYQYLQSNKLERARAAIYSKALRDVLFDLIQKKDNSSYYRNLRYYLPELTQKEYRQNERSVFEYLAKVAKREFRTHLKQLL